jgi:subtilase-type serine protease
MFASTMSANDESAVAKDAKEKQVAENGGWDGFVSGLGNFGTLSSTSDATGYNYSTGGIVGGVDRQIAPGQTLGLLLGYDQSTMTDATGSAVTMTGGQAGLYGGMRLNEWHLGAVLTGALNSYSTNRVFLGQTATATAQGTQWGGQLSVGYDLKAGDGVRVSPYASGQYTSVAVNSFTENGSLLNNTIASQGQGSLSSDLGVSAGKSFDCGGGVLLTPNVTAAWQHLYEGQSPVMNATLQIGGPSYSVDGASTGTDGFLLGIGANAKVSQEINIFAQYQGLVGMTNLSSQQLGGGLSVGF